METPRTDAAYAPGDIYGDSTDRVSRMLTAMQLLETENIHLRKALECIGKLEFGLNHHSPAIVAHEALEALK